MEGGVALSPGQYMYLANLAQQAERYDDTARFIEDMVKLTPAFGELTVEERNLFSTEINRRYDDHAALVKDYRSSVESELSGVCGGILALLDSHLIPSAASSESKVFYLKMKGDYRRQLAEFKVGDERKEAADSTLAAYTEAQGVFVSQELRCKNWFWPKTYGAEELVLAENQFLCSFAGRFSVTGIEVFIISVRLQDGIRRQELLKISIL
ncbi:14-3-3-like protein GF14 kappa [Platanthera zijinensis]|uniref:14-3-3-like protein GF14 kappa n=1 Tax=Platanthera zijinensis TaxID=2320716 RepID=A0AAP0B014_9ASPA